MASTPPPTQGSPGIPSNQSNQSNQNSQEPTQQTSKPGSSPKEFSLTNKNTKSSSTNENENQEGTVDPKKKKDSSSGQALLTSVESKLEGSSGQQDEVKAAGKTEGIGASAKATQLSQISKVVLNMVDSIAHGSGVTQMTLKANDSVPISFQGTQLTIDQTTSKITFQNFKTEAAAMNARDTINGNAQELQNLANALYDKGFRNTTLEIQNVTITLPKAEQALPSPAQVMSDQSNMEREGGGQQGGQQGRQGDDEGPSDRSS